MKLSLEWLSEYVPCDLPPSVYAEAMTMSGSKVERIEEQGGGISGVVVGMVETVEPHPDADRLSVCVVDVGAGGSVQVVTGASNVRPGCLVPIALDGAHLPDGRDIHAGVLRGVESFGMLCSLSELDLTQADFPYASGDGIFILAEEDRQLRLGQDVRDALGLRGHTVDFEITNNRPDCLSVIGLARESAATLGKPLALHQPAVAGGGGPIGGLLAVRIDSPELCPRYTARMVRDVKIGPSPRWLRLRLRASGVRPINNIVDITNYVMLEYGQPMHAFDYACLEGQTVVARRARQGESIVTLDGQVRALSPDMLVIADSRKPVAVAGVMGGAQSEITEHTRDIVFESANFHGPSVRRTAQSLGMRSESSGRFEKGLDPANTEPAVQRACELVERLGAGTVCDGLLDVSFVSGAKRSLAVDSGRINALLGTSLPEEDIFAILHRLGFEKNGCDVIVPSFRADVEGTADLSEEVARLHGYGNIPPMPLPGSAIGGFTAKQAAARLVSDTCRALGYSEILTYSFIGPSWYDKLGLPEDDRRRHSVRITNPLGEDTSVMRTTALPSMLAALAANESSRNKSVRLFELAMTYTPGDSPLPLELPILVLGGYGGMDFFSLKGAVETLLRTLRVEDAVFEPCSSPSHHPGRCAGLNLGGHAAGVLGEIHPDVSASFGCSQRQYTAELDFLSLLAASTPEKSYRPLPRYPSIMRDLAVVCDASVPASELAAAMRRGAGPLLADCRLFDVYTGGSVAEGKKSVAFALELRASDRTLTDREADAAIDGALTELGASCGAALRR